MNDNLIPDDWAKPPGPTQRRFSRRFDAAAVETRLIAAMVKADGGAFEHLAEAPPWLASLYHRHAAAIRQELAAIEASENTLKPSQHD